MEEGKGHLGCPRELSNTGPPAQLVWQTIVMVTVNKLPHQDGPTSHYQPLVGTTIFGSATRPTTVHNITVHVMVLCAEGLLWGHHKETWNLFL